MAYTKFQYATCVSLTYLTHNINYGTPFRDVTYNVMHAL
jgi:hypothetical protein